MFFRDQNTKISPVLASHYRVKVRKRDSEQEEDLFRQLQRVCTIYIVNKSEEIEIPNKDGERGLVKGLTNEEELGYLNHHHGS